VVLSAARMEDWMASELSGLDLLVIQSGELGVLNVGRGVVERLADRDADLLRQDRKADRYRPTSRSFRAAGERHAYRRPSSGARRAVGGHTCTGPAIRMDQNNTA
jgi:hypothetical protein